MMMLLEHLAYMKYIHLYMTMHLSVDSHNIPFDMNKQTVVVQA